MSCASGWGGSGAHNNHHDDYPVAPADYDDKSRGDNRVHAWHKQGCRRQGVHVHVRTLGLLATGSASDAAHSVEPSANTGDNSTVT